MSGTQRYDVVIVGAGIGGSALASVLARAGKQVLVLEQQTTYRDKVRGETVMPWGVIEAGRMELIQTLLDAGGEYGTSFVPYDELRSPADAEAGALPVPMLCPGADGTLNVGHPEASEALSNKAAADGATVVRAIRDVKVGYGADPSVRYVDGSTTVDVSCRLVVGADGRTSTVRRQAGLALEESPAVVFGAGLLVRSDSNSEGINTVGTEGDTHFLAFPRSGGLTRLYQMVDIARQGEFTGPERLDNFLAGFAKLRSFPAAEAIAGGEAAGPAGGSPMTDSTTIGDPVVPGAVLVGDAAGWSDPVIGQGLAIALRDARAVSDVVTTSDDWSPAAFGDYVSERKERMRRIGLSARISTEMRCTFTDGGRERRGRWNNAFMSDPLIMSQVLTNLAGPETAPPEAFTDEAVAATLAL